MAAVEHFTKVCRRPLDQVRPICSCGWQGTTCRNLEDAKAEANAHEAGFAWGDLYAYACSVDESAGLRDERAAS